MRFSIWCTSADMEADLLWLSTKGEKKKKDKNKRTILVDKLHMEEKE